MNSKEPTRRDALKTGLAAIIAAGIAPMIRAEDKVADQPLIVGEGRHKYEVIDGWAHLPKGRDFGDTHSVCEVNDGRMFIHHNGVDSTCIFDPDGKFIEAWGGTTYKNGAHGMDLRKEGNEEFLYLSTTTTRKVVKTNLKGEVVFSLDFPKEALNDQGQPCYKDEKRYSPTYIAFSPNGDFYVTDGYGSAYIHQYTIDGKYIRTWGGGGTADGKFNQPHGIFCDTRDAQNPTILVADRGNVRLQWFTMDGKHIKTVAHDLRNPCQFSERNGDLLIPDLKGRITIFDKDNNLVEHLGDNPNEKQRANHGVKKDDLKPGIFYTPHGATWDKAGNIYLCEWLPYGRVTKLRHIA